MTRSSLALALILGASLPPSSSAEPAKSHPPLRVVPPAPERPKPTGPVKFVDPRVGDDEHAGTQAEPWQSIARALEDLAPGETLYLRGGVYYEQVRVSLQGRADAPITIAAFPGETAVLDGGYREFFDAPAECWEPFPDGAPGEYRSTRRYPNLREPLGWFGDSQIGLHTYFHAADLRSDREHVVLKEDKSDILPLYCGPGLWYDRAAGRLHIRLRHTHVPKFDNYRGGEDPRQLPLVIAPFHALPLHLDGAAHVRVQDLVIRGGGYDTVALDQARDVELDNVTIWAGTYGLRAIGTQRLKLLRCGLYGSVPPWTSRYEAGLNTYPGRTERDITRLNTHALLVTNANPEYSVYHNPFNDDWEIAHCEFTEAHDGLYLGGIGVKFHHNVVDNLQDDGIYLSPMFERHPVFGGGGKLYIYENLFSRTLTTLAFGGTWKTEDRVWFYRNVMDLRTPVPTGRAATADGEASLTLGKATGDHGSPPWSAMNTYHNTFIMDSARTSPDMWMASGSAAGRPRNVFNNIFVHPTRLPDHQLADVPTLQIDANLYWQPGLEPARRDAFFTKHRQSAAFKNSQATYPPGHDAHSLVADPQLALDYRLNPDSPAINAGVKLPADWPDSRSGQDPDAPDLGAFPAGAPRWSVGRR